ncbi:hypothetical protein GCM10008935_17810 [Alkalibacillus silvisoli]|uniref:Uncharacterized protein n=1 Tax=Alkalibacillus silvisoli TaxID=392823 RepID=A0ABP3JS03_9BACI
MSLLVKKLSYEFISEMTAVDFETGEVIGESEYFKTVYVI